MVDLLKVKMIQKDLITSVIIGGIILLAIYLLKLENVQVNIVNNIDVMMPYGFTVSGFLLIALMHLLSHSDEFKVKSMKMFSSYKYTFYVFIQTIITLTTLAVISFIYKISGFILSEIFIPLLIILFIWSIVSFFRCLWLLKNLSVVYLTKNTSKE